MSGRELPPTEECLRDCCKLLSWWKWLLLRIKNYNDDNDDDDDDGDEIAEDKDRDDAPSPLSGGRPPTSHFHLAARTIIWIVLNFNKQTSIIIYFTSDIPHPCPTMASKPDPQMNFPEP